MDFKNYLVRKKIIGNYSAQRPVYLQGSLHSLFRDITEHTTRAIDDPEVRGVTDEEYPLGSSYGIKTYLARKKVIDTLNLERPKYSFRRLYSQLRSVVEHCVRDIDNPLIRGLTVLEYPYSATLDEEIPSFEDMPYVLNESKYIRNYGRWIINTIM